jgi:hypothetical protein
MAADSAAKLRLLAEEVPVERRRIDRTVAELTAAVGVIGRADSTRLHPDGAAAFLETFCSGVEKAPMRIAGATGSLPDGSGWHRRLLDDATLDLPQTQPPVLSESTARMLEPRPFAIASAISIYSTWTLALSCLFSWTLRRLGQLLPRT